MGSAYRRRYIAPVRLDTVPDPPVRPASTVIVLRPSSTGFDVLTVRRGGSAPFMGNARVFPGGALSDIDDGPLIREVVSWSGADEELPWRSAALRELAEEAGLLLGADADAPVTGTDLELITDLYARHLRLDADRLVYLSNWVTPKGLPRRYDTRFYVAGVPASTEAAADYQEVFDAAWTSAAAALEMADDERWIVEFPTRCHLELLAGFHEVQDVLNYAQAQDPVPRVEPRLLVGEDGSWRVLLPGEPGYEEALQ